MPTKTLFALNFAGGNGRCVLRGTAHDVARESQACCKAVLKKVTAEEACHLTKGLALEGIPEGFNVRPSLIECGIDMGAVCCSSSVSFIDFYIL